MSGRHLWLTALVFFLCAPAPGFAQGVGRAAPKVLTTIQAIRALSQDEADKGYRVVVRGIVTHFDEQADTGLIVHDGRFGQDVLSPDVKVPVPAWGSLQKGDAIELEGRGPVRGGFAPNVVPTAVRRVGHAQLPTPKRIAYASMLTGRHDCDYVEVVGGVVLRTWREWRDSEYCIPCSRTSRSKRVSCG